MTDDRRTEALHIEGMTCSHCVAAVRAALESVPGTLVRTVEVGRAEVETDADRARLEAAVGTAGFDVVGR